MRKVIVGVVIAGVVTSIALAVRAQVDDVASGRAGAHVANGRAGERANGRTVAVEAVPVPRVVTAPAHAQAPAPAPAPAPAVAQSQSQPQEPTAKPVARPPHVENAAPFSVPTAAEILKNASAAYTKLQTLRADFVQKRENPILSSTTTSRGTIYQKRPDRFLMKFTAPAGDVIVSDGRYFWVYYPSADKRQVLRALASEQGAGGVDLQAQFLGDPLRRFTNTFHGIEKVNGRDAYVLTLVPRSDMGYKSLKVWIDAKDWLVRRFVLTESNGVVQDYTLSNLAVNPALSNDLFRFTPPADAKIIER